MDAIFSALGWTKKSAPTTTVSTVASPDASTNIPAVTIVNPNTEKNSETALEEATEGELEFAKIELQHLNVQRDLQTLEVAKSQLECILKSEKKRLEDYTLVCYETKVKIDSMSKDIEIKQKQLEQLDVVLEEQKKKEIAANEEKKLIEAAKKLIERQEDPLATVLTHD